MERVSSTARHASDLSPLTPLGVLLLGLDAGAVFYFGRHRQDLVLLVAGLGLAALVLASLILVVGLAGILALWFRFGVKVATQLPERLEAESPVSTGFSLPLLSWLPFVSLRWHWLEPKNVEVATIRGPRRPRRIEERIVHHERGAYEFIVRRLLVGDAFGLARIGLRIRERAPRTVLPATGRPLTVPLLEAMSGGDNISHPLGPPDGDLIEMRRYVAGDPMKHVLWKTYARTRSLMVRLPERAFSPTRRTLAFLVAGEKDEAAAGIARRAIESQAFGPDWRFAADGSDQDARSLAEALILIVRSRAARASQGQGLAPFLKRTSSLGHRRLIVFAPPCPGPWLTEVERAFMGALSGTGATIEAIIGTDGLSARRNLLSWRQLVFFDDAPTDYQPASVDGAQEVAQRLAKVGANVTIIDRQTGKPIGRPLRRQRA